MWLQVRHLGQVVAWHRLVWFPQEVPRQAFIVWLAFRNRLLTRDRAKNWRDHQPCLLCGEPGESKDHIFFACPYSYTIWTMLCDRLVGSRINSDWTITVHSLLRNRLTHLDFMLTKMVFQATVYWCGKRGIGGDMSDLSTPLRFSRITFIRSYPIACLLFNVA